MAGALGASGCEGGEGRRWGGAGGRLGSTSVTACVRRCSTVVQPGRDGLVRVDAELRYLGRVPNALDSERGISNLVTT